MRLRAIFLLLLVLYSGVPSVHGQETTSPQASADDAETLHNELRSLRDGLTEALVAADVERQMNYVHKDVVTTWQNHEVARGHDGLQAFLQKMSLEGQRVFQGYTRKPEPDDLSILHGGDTAIAFGTSVPHYKLLGMEFDLHNRWTATLVKENGRWLIASYHVSANVLDNPVLSAAKQGAYWSGGIGVVIGAVVGCMAMAIAKRKRT